MGPRSNAAVLEANSDEYTTTTLERRPDGWTGEIVRREADSHSVSRTVVNVGSITHLVAQTKRKQPAG